MATLGRRLWFGTARLDETPDTLFGCTTGHSWHGVAGVLFEMSNGVLFVRCFLTVQQCFESVHYRELYNPPAPKVLRRFIGHACNPLVSSVYNSFS